MSRSAIRGRDCRRIYTQGLASFERHDLAAQRFRVYTEWFQWPLFAGIVLLVAESLIPTRRTNAPISRPCKRRVRWPKGWPEDSPAPCSVAGVGTSRFAAHAGVVHASVADAEKDYLRGHYAQADTEYEASAQRRPAEAKLQFDVGAAAYKAGDLKSAATAFQNAIQTGTPLVQQSAYYNLGNAEYRVGERTQQAQPQSTIEHWQAAVKSYDAALQMRPSDGDAKFNRDLVQRKLAQLQQQQAQQQQQQQKNGGKQSQNKGGGQGASAGQKNGSGKSQSPGQNHSQAQGQSPNQGQAQNASPGQGANPSAGHGQSTTPADDHNASSAGAQNPHPGTPGTTPQQGGHAPQLAQGSPAPAGLPNSSGQPVAAAGTPATGQMNQASVQGAAAEPGGLTREEAEHLLDSLKGEEHRLPAGALGLSAQASANNPPLKDW